jgi:glutathione S-transferase
MVTLYKYNPAWGLPDISPFCIKVETYLRMIGVPFTPVVGDGRKAPKQKLPYVDDGGALVADSREIIAHFEAKVENPLDAGISARDRALAAAFRALLEEEVYFYAVYQRWQLDEGWQTYLTAMREYGALVGIPGFLTPLILRSVRKRIIRDAWGQGTGRHSREQVESRLCAALEAVSAQLGDGPYFLGNTPRTIDATVHAFLWALLDAPFESRARTFAKSLGNLAAYVERMRETYYAAPSPAVKRAAPVRLAGNAA